jgi:hypothetical protein
LVLVPELEAEVVQIQLLRISLCYLISVDQEDLVLGGFLFLFFHLQTFLYFPIVLDFRKILSVNIITRFTLVLLRH